MMAITGLAVLLLVTASLWPTLPISQVVIRATLSSLGWMRVKATLSRALIAVSFALLLYAAFWALQGDAPVALAMALPEVAAWFSTFEIATLVDVLVGLGTACMALRASGMNSSIKARTRARRQRRVQQTEPKIANDDEPGGLALAA